MRDYEELIKRLRTMADWVGISFLDDSENVRANLSEAADAIEELQQNIEQYKLYLQDAINDLRSAHEKEQKWISVEDRPITEPGNYITMTNASGKDNGVIAQKFVKKTIRGKPVERWEWHGRISPWVVTHYMNMPEPPKEKT